MQLPKDATEARTRALVESSLPLARSQMKAHIGAQGVFSRSQWVLDVCTCL